METISQRTFHFERCLGAGGFGEVYLATAQGASGLRRRVAVKLLHAHAGVGLDAAQRLRDEGRLLAALNHPNILAVDDLVMLDGRWGLVTEYVEGEDLAELLVKGERLPVKVALNIAHEVAEALEAGWYTPNPETGQPLHLVHRDIKPANIRLSRAGTTKLLDFGIALGDAGREAHTQAGVIVGTMAYMAPERFVGGADDPAGDVYSLGCVLYEMLTGEALVAQLGRVHMVAVMTDPEAHREYIQRCLARFGPGFPPGTVSLLGAMLATDPESRPTGAQLVSMVQQVFLAGEGGCLRVWARPRLWPMPQGSEGHFVGKSLATETPTLDQRPTTELEAPEPKKGKGKLIAITALVLVLLVGAGLALLCTGMAGGILIAR